MSLATFTLRLKTVLVGGVRNFHDLAFGRRIRVASLHRLNRIVGAFVLDVASLLGFDAVR